MEQCGGISWRWEFRSNGCSGEEVSGLWECVWHWLTQQGYQLRTKLIRRVKGRCDAGCTISINRGGVSVHSCGVLVDHLSVVDKHWNKPVSCRTLTCCMKVPVTEWFKHHHVLGYQSPAGTKELEVLSPKSMALSFVCFWACDADRDFGPGLNSKVSFKVAFRAMSPMSQSFGTGAACDGWFNCTVSGL